MRCRTLSFLDTCYFDDVWPTRPHEDDAVELVAVAADGQVLAILDLSFATDDGAVRATIDTVAVHPDHRRRRLAADLLERGLASVRERGATSLDAWTREDAPAVAWYSAHGFTERFRYVHVQADWRHDLAHLGATGGGFTDRRRVPARPDRARRCHAPTLPPRVRVPTDVPRPLAPSARCRAGGAPAGDSSDIACAGDGESGPRIEVLYARASNVPDRYSTYLASFRTWVGDADSYFGASAAETGGRRRLRFVHNASCALVVHNVVLSPTGDDSFNNTVTELQAAGYTRDDRRHRGCCTDR